MGWGNWIIRKMALMHNTLLQPLQVVPLVPARPPHASERACPR